MPKRRPSLLNTPPDPGDPMITQTFCTTMARYNRFNRQTHHRGQLTTLLEQAGCDFGVTDLIWLPDDAGAAYRERRRG